MARDWTPAAVSGSPVLAATAPVRPGVRRSVSRPGTPAARGGVGGVLGELDDQPVAVAAEAEVLLGVRVLAQAGRARRPRRPAPGRGCRRCRTGRSLRSLGPGQGPASTLAAASRLDVAELVQDRAARRAAGRRSTPAWLCAPHPWSRQTTWPSDGRPLVAADPEDRRSVPAIGRKKPQVSHWRGRLLRDAGRADRARRRTSVRRLLAALARQHPLAAQPELPERELSTSCVAGGLEAGLEPRVLGDERQEDTGLRSPGAIRSDQGSQLGREQRPIAGQQRDLVDGRACGPRSAGHRDRPAPAAVRRARCTSKEC